MRFSPHSSAIFWLAALLVAGCSKSIDDALPPVDQAQARTLSQDCEDNRAAACFDLAVLYDERLEDPAYDTSIARYFTRACELGMKQACLRAGVFYIYGFGVGRDLSRAREFYAEACDAGYNEGCMLARQIFPERIRIDRDREINAQPTACAHGILSACRAYRDQRPIE